jgi:hypothetical protein
MKRKLTSDEIECILSEFDKQKLYKSIPAATRLATLSGIKNNIRDQLVKISIYPEGIPKLKADIIKYYYATQIEAGASVGIVTAQSIGERQTQMTLNTFHSAGMAIATVITGVPRFGELLNATANPKMVSCQIYFNDQDHDLDSLRRYIGPDLRQFTLKDLTVSRTVGYKTTPEPWFETYLLFNSVANVRDLCGDDASVDYICCTISLDIKILYEYIISLQSIAENMCSEYDDIIVIPSPLEKHQLDIFINVSQVQHEDFDSIAIAHQIYIDNVVIPTLFDIVVCGIPGINNFFFKRYNKDDKFMATIPDGAGKTGWMVETQGTNYLKLLAHPKMHSSIVISNNMWDIYESLGIEAARQFLIDEFMNVVSSDGTYINICHVMLLVDLMTFSGSISSISRYGIKRDQAGPLAKASFEESLDNFLKAGVFGDVESTKGVSASIMCGKRSKIGSGLCDLLYCIDGSGPSASKHTISTDPVKETGVTPADMATTQLATTTSTKCKETVFTDLSRWLKATKAASINSDTTSTNQSTTSETNESDDSIDNMSDLSEATESDAHSDETKSDDSDDNDLSDSGNFSDPDDLIFDDAEMDGFMDIV